MSKRRVDGYDYLYEVGKSLVVRVQVPASARQVLGKGELKKSFGRNHTTAKAEYYRTVADFKERIHEARSTSVNLVGSRNLALVDPSQEEMEASCHAYFQRMMVHLRGKNVSPVGTPASNRKERADSFKDMIEVFADILDADQWQMMSLDVDGLCEQHSWNIDKSSATYERLCRLMLRARLQAYKNELRILQGSPTLDPDGDEMFGKSPPVKSTAPQNLGDLVKRFKAARSLRWSASTTKNYIIIFRVIEELCGEETPLALIDHDFCIRVRDQLMRIPANYRKMPGLADKPIGEAIQIAQKMGVPLIGPATVNSHLNKMGAIIRYGRDQAWITGNPMTDISVPDPVLPENKRDPFSIVQLNELFATSPWTEAPSSALGRPSRYWAPLASLYSGARLTEICGQRVDEMVEENGVFFFDFRHRPGVRHMKKGKSRRVPVHPELVRLGFWKYVEHVRKAKQEMLFSDVSRHELGKWGDGTSKWFSRKIRDLDLQGENLSFHSLRHTFEDALKRIDLHDTPIGNAITGRWSAGVTKNYGSAYPLERLDDALRRVSYPGLHLKAVEGKAAS